MGNDEKKMIANNHGVAPGVVFDALPTAAPSTNLAKAEQKHRLKLCVLLPHHWSALRGGSEYQASVLVDYVLRNYDVEVTYLTLNADPTCASPYRINQFSSRRGIRRYGTFFDAIRLYRALRREAPDVIYQQVGCAHTGIAAFYSKHNKCRMFWRIASDDDVTVARFDWRRPHLFVERWLLRYGIRNAHGIIAQTHRQQELLSSNFDRSGVVVRNFHPRPIETAAQPAPVRTKKSIVWVANIKPLKNPEAFIRLAASFAARDDTEFVMIGGMQGKTTWLADITAQISALPNLRYLGERTQGDVNATLADAHALVNTSDYEGFSNTFIQAWLRGVPVVSLHVNPDGLLDGRGVGFVSGNERQLHNDVRALLEDPALRQATGDRGRALAREEFSEANIGQIAALLGLTPVAAPASASPMAT